MIESVVRESHIDWRRRPARLETSPNGTIESEGIFSVWYVPRRHFHHRHVHVTRNLSMSNLVPCVILQVACKFHCKFAVSIGSGCHFSASEILRRLDLGQAHASSEEPIKPGAKYDNMTTRCLVDNQFPRLGTPWTFPGNMSGLQLPGQLLLVQMLVYHCMFGAPKGGSGCPRETM